MKLIPEPIRKDFISQGWKICFDVDRINEYSKRKNIYGINGMTVYSEKVIYLADAFQRYVRYGVVRTGSGNKDKKDILESQQYFDNLASMGWLE